MLDVSRRKNESALAEADQRLDLSLPLRAPFAGGPSLLKLASTLVEAPGTRLPRAQAALSGHFCCTRA
jgi:hypothetical protein